VRNGDEFRQIAEGGPATIQLNQESRHGCQDRNTVSPAEKRFLPGEAGFSGFHRSEEEQTSAKICVRWEPDRISAHWLNFPR
jgi:hypothetical protein